MKVLFPAAAAFAASVLSTDVSARAVADIPPTPHFAANDEAQVTDAQLEKRREENNQAASVICEKITVIAGVRTTLEAASSQDGTVTLYPKAFHFADATVTFPPYDPASGKAPDVIIHWPDLVEADELGDDIIIEGKDQHIVLQDQSLTEVPYFTKGFTGDGVTEDIANKLQCYAETVKDDDGGLVRSVSCTDHLGQMSVVEISPGRGQLTHFFDIMMTPTMPMRMGCLWPLDLPQPEPKPEGP